MSATITRRETNFAQWYQDVVAASDFAQPAEGVRGCMVFKPAGYALWEEIQQVLNREIKNTGHQNVYFPLLIPMSLLAKEAQHIEGFAKECAVVTHHRLHSDAFGKLVPDPDSLLNEPLVVRPTSETIIGEALSKWIHSYRDLPVLLNQWCNIMRWEMRPRLFLRTSEFLWQEGHTAHATSDEAMEETEKMLHVYETFMRDFLALDPIIGDKTVAERFPGAVRTTTLEVLLQDGKAIQAGTSHFLGQHFSQAYDITFTDKNQNLQHTWTTSWGVTTRMIGTLIMAHGDDEGLVMPPRIAPIQVAIIPTFKDTDDEQNVKMMCHKIAATLLQLNLMGQPLRVHVDQRPLRSVDKFWRYRRQGVPVCLEIGPRECRDNTVTYTSRVGQSSPKRSQIAVDDFYTILPGLLEEIQKDLLTQSRTRRQQNTYNCENLQQLENLLNLTQETTGQKKKLGGFFCYWLHPNAETSEETQDFYHRFGLSTRCILKPKKGQSTQGICLFSGNVTSQRVAAARAY